MLPAQAPGYAAALAGGRLVGDAMLNRIVLAVTALMEVKSSMGVIVAAPTAGACAALPGAVITLAEDLGLDEEAMARGLLAAGLIGVFICTPWSFAAEVGGCQAEGGSAAAIAAAAIVTLAYGTLASYQILDRDRAGGEESFRNARQALRLVDPPSKASATAMVYRDVSEAYWKMGDRARAIDVFKDGRNAGADMYLYMSSAARAVDPQAGDQPPNEPPSTDRPKVFAGIPAPAKAD